MDTLSIGIIIVLLVYTAIGVLDQISIQIGPYTPLFAAAFTGFVMGDLTTGLLVGATLQLMTLGVATYGGATVPDFLSGAIMGTAYAILSGKGVEYGIGIAIPIGLLLTQMDILGRMVNLFWQKRAAKFAEVGNARGVEMSNVFGIFSWTLSRMIPVFIGLYFGEHVVNLINEAIPVWVMNGLKAAGAILPAMGIAILLHYLPIKKYWSYFIIGFALMAYFSETFSVLGVALIGLALAGIAVINQQNKVKEAAAPQPVAATATGSDLSDNLYADEEVNFND
ncbi:PTS mannose/fructose/sorbose/N-acetylgalactosamine transporter subunit IIC [Lactococcus formosensis]|jgi:Phosphotransferase system, mannose/fructose/N-acetylgalactosamine-specific component IIC|uniref:PTS sugar transporter subunit IIC n=1 Tax=Lactococcus formosensis TaxID=1281486 RepID=A0A9Q8Y2B6_9LACT|nr:PTS sugar transporter subunit IIC [Lactococcus formosensis]NHI73450.1 PTS sugar transporter subunit IIC [Lactococcus garvieae]MDG6120265.1 PTS sugar transporter subunit IIC [Lactococcus formosensis]NHI99753.1 PTS sugar transporter subunit IIC [Lactococcus garvieae]NHJ18272.1 PTS sugar transporter subunit IIC [Lactococcus garvieae]USJ20194.1 PTS sugar transporter subunit IIC [Lactococcus formosensis]